MADGIRSIRVDDCVSIRNRSDPSRGTNREREGGKGSCPHFKGISPFGVRCGDAQSLEGTLIFKLKSNAE